MFIKDTQSQYIQLKMHYGGGSAMVCMVEFQWRQYGPPHVLPAVLVQPRIYRLSLREQLPDRRLPILPKYLDDLRTVLVLLWNGMYQTYVQSLSGSMLMRMERPEIKIRSYR